MQPKGSNIHVGSIRFSYDVFCFYLEFPKLRYSVQNPLRHCLLRSNEGIYYPKTPKNQTNPLGPLGELIILSFPLQQSLVSAALFYSRATVTSFHPFSKGLPCLSPLLASIEILNKRASLEWPTSLWWRITNSPIKLCAPVETGMT